MAGPLLECVVQSVDDALAAERAGAARLELCVQLEVGGTTPPGHLVGAVVAAVRIPVFVLVRPRSGNFVHTDAEQTTMRRDIELAGRAGASGIVIGVLTREARVDVEATRSLVQAANGLPVTFHRAFDETPDLQDALEAVVATGASRVLTSGGARTAWEGAAALAGLVARAGERIVILAGGGVRANNVSALVARTGVREIHARFDSEAATRQMIDLL